MRIALRSDDLNPPARVAQLQALGASRAEADWVELGSTQVTLADPEGNEFSIMTPHDP